jgi:DNA-binding transcriptional LysR family regulator
MTRGLAPTEAGIRFYKHARLAIESPDKAELAARGASADLMGILYVAAAPTFMGFHIMPHLSKFMAAHPKLEIELILDDRIVDLIEEGIDISLRMGLLPGAATTARKIATTARSLMASRPYITKYGAPEMPCDLSRHEVLVHSHHRLKAWTFARDSNEISVPVRGRLRINSAEGLRSAVLSGLGLTIASHWMFAPELTTGEIRIVLPEWRLEPAIVWAIYPTGKRVSFKTAAFVDFVENTLAETCSTCVRY